MILVVVYVGAVAVLFFRSHDVRHKFRRIKTGFMQYLPIGALLGLILLVELFFVIGIWSFAEDGSMLAQLFLFKILLIRMHWAMSFTPNMYICFRLQG